MARYQHGQIVKISGRWFVRYWIDRGYAKRKRVSHFLGPASKDEQVPPEEIKRKAAERMELINDEEHLARVVRICSPGGYWWELECLEHGISFRGILGLREPGPKELEYMYREVKAWVLERQKENEWRKEWQKANRSLTEVKRHLRNPSRSRAVASKQEQTSPTS